MKPTVILIIRHGQTAWNKEGRLMGITDIPLSEEGKAQARAMADYLRNYAIDVITTSPLSRAAETAAIIRSHHPATPAIILDSLKERSFGDMEGAAYEEANRRHFQLVYTETWNYTEFKPKNGESLTDVRKRARHAKELLLSRYPGKTIAVVTHGAYAKMFLSELSGIPAILLSAYDMANASLTVVRHSAEDGGSIDLINRLP